MKAQNIIYYFVFHYSNLFLGLLFFYLLRIWFPIDIVGLYSYYLSIITFFTFITDLGFNFAHLKIYSQKESPEEKKMCVGSFVIIQLILTSIYLGTILTYILLNASILDFNIIIIFLISQILVQLSFIQKIVFLSEDKVIKFQLPELFLLLTKNIIIIFFSFLGNTSLMDIGIIYLISSLIELGISTFIFRKIKIKMPTIIIIKEYIRFTFPLFFSFALTVIFSNIDILWIKSWYSNYEVANYYTAKTLINYIMIIPTTFSFIMITQFAKKNSTSLDSESEGTIKMITRYLVILMFLITIFCWMFLKDLIIIYLGPYYEQTADFFNILILDLIIISLFAAYNSKLNAMGKTTFIAIISIIKNGFGIILLFFFINPKYFSFGAIGAAYAIVINELFILIVFRQYYFRKFKFKFYWGSFKIIFLILGILIIHNFLNIYINSLWLIMIWSFFSIMIFVGGLFLVKELNKNDIKFILNLLKLKQINKEIIAELKDIF